jgi:hypothetical protein
VVKPPLKNDEMYNLIQALNVEDNADNLGILPPEISI